ncbi:MAG: ankyrin repeat domain-containing protein [Planctomycetota bacterium]|jgi:ankyrin repeat protein
MRCHIAGFALVILVLTGGCRRKEEAPPTPADLMMKAAAEGNIEKVKSLLATDPSLLTARDENQKTPLHQAASGGHTEVVKFLLEKGADPTARDKWNITPTERAALKGHHELAALLMAAPLPENATGEKPLYSKERERRREMNELLDEASGRRESAQDAP